MDKLDVIAEFREDHRKVRDGLLELIEVLQSRILEMTISK